MTCATCGFVASGGEALCRRCGGRLPFALPSRDLAVDQSAVPAYGLPRTSQGYPGSSYSAATGQGVWRDGKTLVMHKAARLPDRCIKCGTPANGCYLRKRLSWHHPALALLVLASPLIYAVVALVVRKSATVEISLCEDHLRRHRTAVIVSWLIFIASTAFIVLAIVEGSGGSAIFGVFLLFVSAIYAVIWAKIVTVRKIDDHHVWLRRIDENFLATLPSLTKG